MDDNKEKVSTLQSLVEEAARDIIHKLAKRRLLRRRCIRLVPPPNESDGDYTIHLHTPAGWKFWQDRYAFVYNEQTEAYNYISPDMMNALIVAKPRNWIEVMAIVRGMEDE